MSRSKSLTPKIKVNLKPFIPLRDYNIDTYDIEKMWCLDCGNKFYEIPFEAFSLEWDHLDQDPSNNELWNLQFLCRDCNNKKKQIFNKQFPSTTDAQYIKKVHNKIAQNKHWQAAFDFDKYYRKQHLESLLVDPETTTLTVSQQLRRSCIKILTQELSHYPSSALLSDLADLAAEDCYDNCGFGTAPVASRKILSICTKPGSGFSKQKNGVSWVISAEKPI